MKPLSFKDFDKLYQDVLSNVMQYWSREMQEEVAVHNYGWSPETFDFKYDLAISSARYYKAYRSFAGDGGKRKVCDIGGFWGAFPITLRLLGYDVTMTETKHYYSSAFDNIFKHIIDHGVKIVDYDPFVPGNPLESKFDVVTILAVLEHYPHSLKAFMENISSIIAQNGRLYIEVPNIAQWSKRTNFLVSGRTPLIPVTDILKSKVPFIGHHHEFTISELRELVKLSGMTIISEYFFNYSPGHLFDMSTMFRRPIAFLAYLLARSTRQSLAVLCMPTGR